MMVSDRGQLVDVSEVEREARRLCQRYVDELVLPFSLCPWAPTSLQQNSVEMPVITDFLVAPTDYSHAARAILRAFESLRETTELGIVILPRLQCGRLQMDELLREIRKQQAEHGEETFALAAFHPDAPFDPSSPERLIPYLRRTPDPVVQGIRSSTLDRIDPTRGSGTSFFNPAQLDFSGKHGRSGSESLRLRVAKANLTTVTEVGHDAMETIIDDILADRMRTWSRILGAEFQA